MEKISYLTKRQFEGKKQAEKYDCISIEIRRWGGGGGEKEKKKKGKKVQGV